MNEREMEILERYPFRTERISRVRGAFLCETEEGLRLLKETESTENRLRWENEILQKFPEDGLLRVESYVENREGELLTVGSDRRRYAVKRWFEGRECNMGDEREILRTVELLAELHVKLKEISDELVKALPEDLTDSEHLCSGTTEGENAKPETSGEPTLQRIFKDQRGNRTWVSDLERHNRELIRVRNYIRKKRRKTELELKILADFPEYYERAVEALKLAEETEPIPGGLYHGDFTHHHILHHGKEAAIIEFAHMGMGVQQEDLYLFLRKTLEKHGWNPALGMSMLDRYESVRPLAAAEGRFLYVRLLYPEKFWKQVNYYCNSRKSWMPLRNLEKLKALEKQRGPMNAFLEALEQRMM